MNLTRRHFLAAVGAATGAAVTACAPGAAAAQAGSVYPDDAFSRPSLDCLTVFRHGSGCAPASDPISRSKVFSVNRLVFGEAGDSRLLLWEAQPREAAERALVVETRIRRMPRAIYLQVHSRSSKDIRLTLQANEVSWLPVSENTACSWMLGGGQKLAAAQSARLRFDLKDARPVGEHPDRPVRFPLTSLVLRLDCDEPEALTVLALEALDVEYGPAEGMELTALQMPRKVACGDSIRVEIEARGEVAGRTVDLEVRRGERTMWRIRLSRAQARQLQRERLILNVCVPWYLSGATYEAGLTADGYRIPGASASFRVAPGSSAGFPRAERRLHQGRPAMFVNGLLRIWQGYSSYDYQPGNVGQFGLSGATVFSVPTCAGAHVHNVSEPTWPEPDVWDFSELEERVCFTLQHAPDALIMPRVSIALPLHWVRRHEQERALVSTPDGLREWEETMTPAVSIASREWMGAQKEALRRLVSYCRSSPWASRVAGFLLTGEVTEEWFAWGCNNDLLADYSEPNRKAFGNWLTSRGHQPAAIPPPNGRQPAGTDIYGPDEASVTAARYSRFYSELTSDVICELARVVKDETGGRSLVGCFNGYVVQLAGEPRQATSGHFAVRRLLDDNNIDFVAGIPLLDYRRLLDGYNPFAAAAESAMASGKLYLNENDLFSWLHPIIWHTRYDEDNPRAGAIAMHRRECAHDAVTGAMSQKFSLMCSWHADRALHRDFQLQIEAAGRAASFDRTPAHEIAFLIDETSFAWTPPKSTLKAWTHKALLHRLGRLGTSVGVWLLDDVGRLPESVKLIVVADAASAPPDVLKMLLSEMKRSARSFLLVGPAGLVDPGTGEWDPNAPARLLGLPIRVADEPGPQVVLGASREVVTRLDARPRPYAWSESAGRLSFEDGRSAWDERPLSGGGRLYWTSLPPIEGPDLGEIAADSGVHFYAPEGSIVHASHELLAVTYCGQEAGQMTVTLKRQANAEDLYDGWTGEGLDLSPHFKPGQTRLLALRYKK